MSSLLTLAKDLEQQSKVQQQRTGEMLKTAFSEHEKSVRTELTASAERISNAISAHERAMTEAMQSNRRSVLRMVGNMWLTITIVSVLLFASLSGVLWYQGNRIGANQAEIEQQNKTLSELNAKTWGVRYQENSEGRFLILPEGMKADTNWTFDNGRKNGIRLVKE